MTDAPNILLITADQHRFDALGCMGNREVPTRNIDRLAGQGVLFERCYVTNPVCMPCRASFMTGQFPDAHGVRRNGIPVPDVPYSLARTLRGQDLRTGVIGKTHFASLRRDYAPDYQFPEWRGGADYFGFGERAITIGRFAGLYLKDGGFQNHRTFVIMAASLVTLPVLWLYISCNATSSRASRNHSPVRRLAMPPNRCATSSAMCSTCTGEPRLRRMARRWAMQPGLSVTTVNTPVAAMAASLRSATAAATAG
jgi:hypothetical protein